MRPSRHTTNITIALAISARGTCERAKVGVVITRHGRIISTGYNGSLIRDIYPQIVDRGCQALGCDLNSKCLHAVHAEANAISFAAREGIALEGAMMYCTMEPCYDCAKLIIQAGITEVMYHTEYRHHAGIELLKEGKVKVTQYAE